MTTKCRSEVDSYFEKLLFTDAKPNEHRYYYFVKMTPVVLLRARHGRNVFTPKKSQQAKDFIRNSIVYEGFRQTGYKPPLQPHEGDIHMLLTFFFNRPKRGAEKKEFRTGRGDLSNFVKLVEDALQGIIYRNDNQIVHFEASQRYTDKTEGVAIGIIAYD